MSTKVEFNCLPTAIGSMSHTDAGEACRLVTKYLGEVPHWPQLPKRSQLENMYVQFSEGFPGLVLEGTKLFVEREDDFDAQLEALFTAASDDKADDYGISEKYAAGLHALAATKLRAPRVIKGQVTGPKIGRAHV